MSKRQRTELCLQFDPLTWCTSSDNLDGRERFPQASFQKLVQGTVWTECRVVMPQERMDVDEWQWWTVSETNRSVTYRGGCPHTWFIHPPQNYATKSVVEMKVVSEDCIWRFLLFPWTYLQLKGNMETTSRLIVGSSICASPFVEWNTVQTRFVVAALHLFHNKTKGAIPFVFKVI